MGPTLHSHLQGLSAFVHTVETGNFTAAASRMGLSKSAVGKSVARLEERLGVRLLERTTRSLNLTPEGRTYYESCLRVIEELGTTETLLASRRRQVAGTLRISLPLSFGRGCVMPVLATLAERHPDLDLDVSFTDRFVDLVEEGIDLAVRLGDPGNAASLIGRSLGAQRPVICAAPSYLDRRGRPASVEALSSHDCLAFGKDGRPLPWQVLGEDGRTRAFVVRPRHTVSHGEALRDAAMAGLGIACLSTWLVADALREGRLEALAIPLPDSDMAITALWPRSRDLAPKIRVTVDELVAAFLPVPPWDR